MSGIHPFTGFGDDPNSSIKFSMLYDRGDEIPDWEGAPRLAQHPLVHSSGTVIQHGGLEPWTITFRVHFESRQDKEMLAHVQGQAATLRYLYGITMDVGGTAESGLGDVVYLNLPDTLLLSVANAVNYIDGSSEADVTFQRSAEAAS